MTSASLISSLAAVEPGCLVWSRSRRYGGSESPVGGLVWAVGAVADPDTAELRQCYSLVEPSFAWARRGQLGLVDLYEDDLDLSVSEPASPSRCAATIRAAAKEIAETKGTMAPRVGTLIEIQRRLWVAANGGMAPVRWVDPDASDPAGRP